LEELEKTEETEEKETPPPSFEFKQCVSILKATGKRASTLPELTDLISRVSDQSIFHHTYQYFLKGRIREYTNDFAQWAGVSLEERELAEQLSNIDPYEFEEIADLRKVLVEVMDRYMERFPEPRAAMRGDEFYFSETVTFVFPVGLIAKNLAEFLMGIKYVDLGCLYYHFYEARFRQRADDFSSWIDQALGKKELADRIRSLDPFMHTLEGVRAHLVDEVEEEVRRDMEGAMP
jgi:hypothetical protein